MDSQDNLNPTIVTESNLPDKQEKAGTNNPTGIGGFQDHPELINRAGRPKKKTLTEVIYAKLLEKLKDHPDKDGFDALAAIVLNMSTVKKDKDIIKKLWEYLDGMPKQKMELGGEDDGPLVVEIIEHKEKKNE